MVPQALSTQRTMVTVRTCIYFGESLISLLFTKVLRGGVERAKAETSDSSQREVGPLSPACLTIEKPLPGNTLKARMPRALESRVQQQRHRTFPLSSEHTMLGATKLPPYIPTGTDKSCSHPQQQVQQGRLSHAVPGPPAMVLAWWEPAAL